MSLSFQTEILPKHVRAATAGIFWRQVLQPWALGPLGALWAGGHLTLAALFPMAGVGMHLNLGLLFWGTLLGVAWMAKRHYEALALENFKRFEGAPVLVRLEGAGYGYTADWGRGEIPWNQFQSLWRFGEVWVLLQHISNGVSVLLPTESLDGQARAFIVERVTLEKAAIH